MFEWQGLKNLFQSRSKLCVIGALLVISLLFASILLERFLDASHEDTALVEYLAEIVLSESKPMYKGRPRETSPIRLVSFDLEKQESCIEVYDGNKWKGYCAKKGEYFGRGHGIQLRKVTPDSVVIHLHWGGSLKSSRYSRYVWAPSRPAHKAAAKSDLLKLRKLLKDEPSRLDEQDQHRMTPLMWAAYRGQEDTVKFLLEKGAGQGTAVQPVRFLQTPLHLAAQEGHKKVAKILLEHKANINAQDIYGATPLQLAVLSGREDLVELLIANGAEINHVNEDGFTPLHCAVAAYNRNKNIMELLISHQALVNAKDNKGQTPLHLAAKMGRREAAELLLAHNANVNAVDEEGKTTLKLAVENGSKEVAEVLRKHGAAE